MAKEQEVSGGSSELAARPGLVMLVVGVGTLLSAMAGSMLNLALPSIGHELGISVDLGGWILLSYLLAVTALLLVAGRASDFLGHRRVYLAGFVLFGLASLGCGLAPSFSGAPRLSPRPRRRRRDGDGHRACLAHHYVSTRAPRSCLGHGSNRHLHRPHRGSGARRLVGGDARLALDLLHQRSDRASWSSGWASSSCLRRGGATMPRWITPALRRWCWGCRRCSSRWRKGRVGASPPS